MTHSNHFNQKFSLRLTFKDKSLKNPPAIILTTAYREYALDGYDLDIIDYLLKPIAFERFLKSVDRYREKQPTNKTDNSISENESPSKQEHIFFNVNKTHRKIVLNDILYIESLKDYTKIHSKDDSLVVKGNIGSTLKLLPEISFVRIHRSFAVAVQKVESYNQSKIEIAGKQLPIGLSFKSELLQRLTELKLLLVVSC